MGGGAKKAHESFAVSPTVLAGVVSPEDGAASALAAAEVTVDAEQHPGVAAVTDQLAAIQALPIGEGAPGDEYADLVAAHAGAQSALETVAEAALPPAELAALEAQLKSGCAEKLAGASDSWLQTVAAAEGFEHPTMVGLTPDTPSALAHWLNPAYPEDAPSKAAIQAAALERYAEVAAGSTAYGVSLDQVHAAEAAAGVAAPALAGWVATSEQYQAVHAEAVAAVTSCTSALSSEQLSALLAAEQRVVTAQVPGMAAEELAASKAALVHQLDSTFTDLAPSKATLVPVADQAVAGGTLTSEQAHVLSAPQVLRMLRASTPAAEREGLAAEASTRMQQLQALDAARAALPGHEALTPGVGQLPAYAAACHSYREAEATTTWLGSALKAKELHEGLSGAEPLPSAVRTAQFKEWAKAQKLADLRSAGTAMGLENATVATRAQVQNYIAASWDPSLDAAKVSAAVKAKAAKGSVPAKAVTPPTGGGWKTPGPAAAVVTAAAAGSQPGGPTGSFVAKQRAMHGALMHFAASAGELPERRPSAEVEALALTPVAAAKVGGAHPKAFYRDEGGGRWMFKPDEGAGGAAAHAEACAALVAAHGGTASVPVYVRAVGSRTGSLQPMLSSATPLSSDISALSQHDVDAIVRSHVSAWLVGDHDAKPDNVVRTGPGGLVPVDHGQAFKFYGSDELSMSYNPNHAANGDRTLYQKLYRAHTKGKLAPGVRVRPEVALVTIARYEKLPDEQFRSMLVPVARAGTTHRVSWYSTMASRASKRLGRAPADAEVEEEFLAYAVERKRGLRARFTEFFASALASAA